MKFRLDIELGNAAMTDSDDVAQALLSHAGKIAAVMGEEGDSGIVRDESGAKVGEWKFSDKLNDAPRVGDKDTTGDTGNCYDDYNSFYDSDGDTLWNCCLEDGHAGPHVAGNGRVIVGVWESA